MPTKYHSSSADHSERSTDSTESPNIKLEISAYEQFKIAAKSTKTQLKKSTGNSADAIIRRPSDIGQEDTEAAERSRNYVKKFTKTELLPQKEQLDVYYFFELKDFKDRITLPLDYPKLSSSFKFQSNWTCEEAINKIHCELKIPQSVKTGNEAFYIVEKKVALPLSLQLGFLDPQDLLVLSKDASLLEVNDVEFDKINRLTQRKYHHGQMNQELQKLKELHERQSEKLRKKHLKEIEDLMSTVQTVQKIEFPKLLIPTMLLIQPQVEEDYAAVRAFHRSTFFHYIFGKGLPTLAFEAPPSLPLNPAKKVQPADAVVTDALIFAMHTGGPKEEFDALLNNATLTQLNSLSSKGMTAIFYACKSGLFEKAVSLVNAGVDVNVKSLDDKIYQTPMQTAIRNNDDRIVALLLASGAYIEEMRCEIINRIERTKMEGFSHSPFLKPFYLYLTGGSQHLLMGYPEIEVLKFFQIRKRNSLRLYQVMETKGLWGYSPCELARLLTGYDKNLFQQIPLTEFSNTSAYSKPLLSPHLTKISAHFNRLAYAVQSAIITEVNVQDRYYLLATILQTIDELGKLNNFQSYFAFSTAIKSTSIQRLKCYRAIRNYQPKREVLKSLSSTDGEDLLLEQEPPEAFVSYTLIEDCRKIMENIDFLMDPQRNYENLRGRIDGINEQFVIIFLGLLQKDVIYFQQSNEATADTQVKALYKKMKLLSSYALPEPTPAPNARRSNSDSPKRVITLPRSNSTGGKDEIRRPRPKTFAFFDKFVENLWALDSEDLIHQASLATEAKIVKNVKSDKARASSKKGEGSIEQIFRNHLVFGGGVSEQQQRKQKKQMQKEEQDRLMAQIFLEKHVHYETEMSARIVCSILLDLLRKDLEHRDLTITSHAPNPTAPVSVSPSNMTMPALPSLPSSLTFHKCLLQLRCPSFYADRMSKAPLEVSNEFLQVISHYVYYDTIDYKYLETLSMKYIFEIYKLTKYFTLPYLRKLLFYYLIGRPGINVIINDLDFVDMDDVDDNHSVNVSTLQENMYKLLDALMLLKGEYGEG